MPKVAILSDIHSNLPALNQVLRDVAQSGAETVYFLGDIVGYGAQPAECVEWVRKLGSRCVMGNHDLAMLQYRRPGYEPPQKNWRKDDYAAGLMHSARSLDDAQAEWVRALPFWGRIPGAVVAHASLDDPGHFNYIEDAGSAAPTLELLATMAEPVGFFGHTHRQEFFAADPDGIEVLSAQRFRIPEGMPCAVMVGSVGQNRHETDRRACWVLWDPVTREFEFRGVEYDRREAARRIVAAGLPRDGAMRLLAPDEGI